jgi:phosphoketolase
MRAVLLANATVSQALVPPRRRPTRFIKKVLNAIFIVGPGHGAPALISNTYQDV